MPSLYDARTYRQARKRLKGLPCHWCGTTSDTVDHLREVSRGGTNQPGNLVPACAACNSRRGQALSVKRRKANRREHGTRRW